MLRGRPHRMAQIIKQPEALEVIPRELLERFVAEHQPQENGTVATTADPSAVDELRQLLTKPGLEIKSEGPYQDSYRFALDHCVFNEEHREAAVCPAHGWQAWLSLLPQKLCRQALVGLPPAARAGTGSGGGT